MNEFVVLALDALLHLASVAVLGVVTVLASKLLTRGFVDAKLFTGLLIAALMVITRVFLLNNIDRVLPGMGGGILQIAIIACLFITAFILIYKLVAIPAFGTILSATVVVAAQLALANYTPKLSLKLMPEGQRFAEYAGLANDRTKQLMTEAKAFRGQSGGIRKILADAAKSLSFFTSEEEQENLSKDFASGLALYKERKAYMDSMSPEELAEYRSAMGSFLQEHGLAEDRYSLSNLKNAKPEDLENLASFMKDMNQVYGFTDDMPTDSEGEELPPTAESLELIAANLQKVNLSLEDSNRLGSILTDLGIDPEDFQSRITEAKEVLGEFKEVADTIGQSKELLDKINQFKVRKPGEAAEEIIESGGYRIKRIPTVPDYAKDSAGEQVQQRVETINSDGEPVTYFLPQSMPTVTEEVAPFSAPPSPGTLTPATPELKEFTPAELAPITTDQCIVHIPNSSEIKAPWLKIAQEIEVDAWFAGAGEADRATLFIKGEGLQTGDVWERQEGNTIYRFRFDGITANQITLTALGSITTQ